MKNFHIDSILKTATTLGYVCVYLVVGYSVVGIIRTRAILSSEKEVSTAMATTSITQVQTTTPTVQKVATIEKKIQPSPIVIKNTDTPAPTPDTRCIISVDGAAYNVTEFKKEHSGGDVFTCGADMSAIFHGQHDMDILRKMDQYKI